MPPWKLLAALAVLLASSSAFAQVDNGAIAESLFNDGKKLLDAGKAAQACPKFAESLRLAPTLGTRLNLARCYETIGRTASAWSQYKEVVRTGVDDTKRATIAAERIAVLEPELARLLLTGAVDPGVKITLDGDALDAAVVGTAFPIDPGDHALVVSATGKKTHTTEVHVAPKKTQTVELGPLESEAPEQPVTPPVTPQPEARPQPAAQVDHGKRIGGWAAIGAGAVALGFGVAFGIVTLDLASDVRSGCIPNGPCPTQSLNDENSSAHTDAILADVLIPVGLVAAGVGVWLVMSSSHASKPSPMALRVLPLVSSSGAGLSMGGRF